MIYVIAIAAGLYIGGWYLYTRYGLKNAPCNILAMHDIGDHFDLSISRVTTGGLDRLLRQLAQTGRRGTSLSESDQSDAIALTFDDGLENFYDLAFPILQKHGFSATVFLVADYIGKTTSWDYHKRPHLNWEQITELVAAGIEFGSHSATHRDLRDLDDEDLQYELLGSKKFIENKLGQPVKYISYPFGRYDDRVIRFSKKAGYQRAFGLARGKGDFVLPRACVYLYDTPYSIERKLRGHWLETCKDHINNSLAGGTIILKKFLPEKS